MIHVIAAFALLSSAGTDPQGARAAAPAAESDLARAVAREQERLARTQVLWPGFEPLAVPLAVYTGAATWLFRHPSPPGGFVPAGAGAHVHEGRHAVVTSNSSAELGGVVTATVLADGERAAQGATALAAVALHEAFHVYQRQHHATWIGDEGVLMTYPVGDTVALALRRRETEALRRAVAAPDEAIARCWAAEALAARKRRFAALGATAAAYERANELNEGLASWVQGRAHGPGIELPLGGFAPEQVRHRAYGVGPALAELLDRLRPGWAPELERDDRQALDELLAPAVSGADMARCGFTAEELQSVEVRAARDVDEMLDRRRQRRDDFDARPGWRVVVESPHAPLWPQGFDPLNLEQVEGGLLHTRFLKLGCDAGTVLAVDGPGADVVALTESAGPHPLFDGVRRVVVAGLETPVVTRKQDEVAVRAPGLVVDLARADVEKDSATRSVVIRVPR